MFGGSGSVAREVAFRELCIFNELPFCSSLKSFGESPDGQRETKFSMRRGMENGGSGVLLQG